GGRSTSRTAMSTAGREWIRRRGKFTYTLEKMTRLREALANRGFRRLRRRSAMQFSRQPESASANCRCPKRDSPRILFLEEQTLHSRGVGLLDQLQVEGDAHTVDEHHALVEQLLE